jgi:hypothetical protein
VLYARDGTPERGIVVGDLLEGGRFVANTPSDRSFLEDFVREERVGARGRLRVEKGLNVFELR